MTTKGNYFTFQKIVLFFVSISCIIPFIYLLIFSLQKNTFQEILFNSKEFYKWFWNSCYYTFSTILINIPVSILSGFGFSQYEFYGKKFLFLFYIILMLLPFQSVVVPQYLLLSSFDLLNTPFSIILTCSYNTFGTYLITQYVKNIDYEIIEAARLSGANDWILLTEIILPICKPIIASLFVLQFISIWSIVDQPLMFIKEETLFPLSLKLNSGIFENNVYAAGVIYSIPPLLLYFYLKKQIERGIGLSSLK